MENHHQQAWRVTRPAAAVPPPSPPPPLGAGEPTSFLQEEEDEFERLFTELLYASHSKAAAKMAAQEEDGEVDGVEHYYGEPPPPPPPSQYPSLRRCRSSPPGWAGSARGEWDGRAGGEWSTQCTDDVHSLEAQGVLLVSGGEEDQAGGGEPDTEQDAGLCYWDPGVVVHRVGGGGDGEDCYNNLYHQYRRYSDGSQSSSDDDLGYSAYGGGGLPVLRVDESEDEEEEELPEQEEKERPLSLTDSMERLTGLRRRNRPTQQQLEAFRKSHSFQMGDSLSRNSANSVPTNEARQAAMRDRHSEGSFGSAPETVTRGGDGGGGADTGDKLFFDLLDDLDNITGNTPSMKRRQRARDMFSDWLFSEKEKASSGGARGGEEKKKNRKSFHEFMSYRDEDGQQDGSGSHEGDSQEEGAERLNRAGSEPSDGKHASGSVGSNNNMRTSGGYGNYDFKPLQRREDSLSLSEQDALLERRIREDYLATQSMAAGSRSPSGVATGTGSPLMKRKGLQPSVSRDLGSPNRSSPTSSGSLLAAISKKLSTMTTSFPKHAPQHPKSPPQTSPSSTSVPSSKQPRSPTTSGFCASNAADTLEMLRNVKFRKQNKCQVFSEAEAEAKVEQQQQLSSKLLALEVRPRNIYQRWKLKDRPLLFEYLDEDDADSGYHTGESTLRGAGGAPTPAPQPPGERTLTREDLKRRIDAFNDNQHGLLMTLRESNDTFQGFVRVYMNLMRPISMSLTARPPSIYDILTADVNDDPQEYESDTQLTSFYLPKDTTKVIHISSNTTAQEVIRALLQKFRITDNPRKFALYERIDEGSSKSTMRRLRDDECPLPLCLCWTAEGLNFHRFILQENDTGEILWDAFSVPELDNFLRILDREEEEYVEQVKAKYSMMKLQMVQHMKHLDQRRLPNKDQRTPVFV